MISIKKGINIFYGNELVYNSILKFLSDEYNIVEFYNSSNKLNSSTYTNRQFNIKNFRKIIDDNLFRVDLISVKTSDIPNEEIYKYLLTKNLPIFAYTDDISSYSKDLYKDMFLESYFTELNMGNLLRTSFDEVRFDEYYFITDSKGNTFSYKSFIKSFIRDKSIKIILDSDNDNNNN